MTWLSEMEYPHWLMVAGALLVVAGFLGLGFSWYMNRAPAEDNLRPEAPSNSSVEEEEISATVAGYASSRLRLKGTEETVMSTKLVPPKGPTRPICSHLSNSTLEANTRLATMKTTEAQSV